MHWDVLVIDEAHEGVDTYKTDRAFDQVKRDFTLHLSGTPFKALAMINLKMMKFITGLMLMNKRLRKIGLVKLKTHTLRYLN